MKNYGKFVSGLLVTWFLFALFASALQLFKNDSNRFGVAVAIAALAPILLFFLWFTASRSFRQFTLSLDPAILTSLQAWRIVGFTFVLLEAHRVLPAVFALPAGYGDMAIGATAAFAAWKLSNPANRNAFLLWQVLGIADLVTAVTLGTTAFLLSPHDASMVPLTLLPLSIIPTFLVPLFLIFHVICIAQAKSWEVASRRTRPIVGPAQPAAL